MEASFHGAKARRPDLRVSGETSNPFEYVDGNTSCVGPLLGGIDFEPLLLGVL